MRGLTFLPLATVLWIILQFMIQIHAKDSLPNEEEFEFTENKLNKLTFNEILHGVSQGEYFEPHRFDRAADQKNEEQEKQKLNKMTRDREKFNKKTMDREKRKDMEMNKNKNMKPKGNHSINRKILKKTHKNSNNIVKKQKPFNVQRDKKAKVLNKKEGNVDKIRSKNIKDTEKSLGDKKDKIILKKTNRSKGTPSSNKQKDNGKPKRKPKVKCEKRKRCEKAKGKCKKNNLIEKKPEGFCSNRIENACRSKPRAQCTCCLKSGKCKNYASNECLENNGKGKPVNTCKKEGKFRWAFGNECTCCLPCKTRNSCARRDGECRLKCKLGEIKGGKCGGNCKCCRMNNVPTNAPTTNKPTTDEPTNNKPTTDDPTTNKPTTDAPTTNEPTTDAPTTNKPTTDAPTTNEPTTDAPKTTKTTIPPSTVITTVNPTTIATPKAALSRSARKLTYSFSSLGAFNQKCEYTETGDTESCRNNPEKSETDEKRRRSLEMDSYHIEMRQSYPIVDNDIFIRIQQIVYTWSVKSVTFSVDDIPEVDILTKEIEGIKEEFLEGKVAIAFKSFKVIESTAKSALYMTTKINKEAKKEETVLDLVKTIQIAKEMQSTISVISITIFDLEAFVSEGVNGTGNTNSSVMTIIEKITKIIKKINISTAEAITPKASETLVSLSTDLKQVSNNNMSYTGQEIEHIMNASIMLNETLDKFDSIITELENRRELNENSFLLFELEDAINSVEVSIDEIETAIRKQNQSTDAKPPIIIVIKNETRNAITSLISSVENVNQDQIDAISKFVTDAEDIKYQISQSPVTIKGFNALKSFTKKLGQEVSKEVDKYSTQDITYESIDRLETAEYLITELIYLSEDIEEITQDFPEKKNYTEVIDIKEFIKTLDTVTLSEEAVNTLRKHIDTMEIILMNITNTGIKGINDLIKEADTQVLNIVERITAFEEKKENKKQAELAAKTVTLTTSVQKTIETLQSKIDSASSKTSIEINELVGTLIDLMTSILSTKEGFTLENVVKLEETSKSFASEVSLVEDLKSVQNIDKLRNLTKETVKLAVSEEILLNNVLETEEKLQVLYESLVILDDMEVFVNTLISKAIGNISYWIIPLKEIKDTLESWELEFLTIKEVDELNGMYETLTLFTVDDEVGGLNDLLETIQSIKKAINGEIDTKEITSFGISAAVILDEALTFALIANEYLQEIIYITETSNSDTTLPEYSLEIARYIESLSIITDKKLNVTEEEVRDLENAVIAIEVLLNEYVNGGEIKPLSNVEEGIIETEFLVLIISREVDKVKSSGTNIALYKSIKTKLNQIKTSFEQLSRLNSDAIDVESLTIENLVTYLIEIQDESYSLTVFDLDLFEAFDLDIKFISFSFTGDERYNGYSYSFEETVEEIMKTTVMIEGIINAEEEFEDSLSKMNTIADLKILFEIIITILKKISSFTEIEYGTIEEYYFMREVFQSITENVSAIQSTSEVENILTSLKDIEKSNKTSIEVAAVLQDAETAKAAIDEEIRKFDVDINSRQVIEKAAYLLSVLDEMIEELEYAIEFLEPSQLIGEPDDNFKTLAIYYEMLFENIDAFDETDISDMEETFFEVINKVYESSPDENICDFLDTINSAKKARDEIQIRLENEINKSSIEK